MFELLLVVGLIVALWAGFRLPETRSEEDASHPLSLGASLKLAVETPQTSGYALAGGCMFGCLMGYVSSAEQVFVDVYKLGDNFPFAFGGIASLMALASLTNAQLVENLGMRRVSHWALIGFTLVSFALAAAAAVGVASFTLFAVLMAAIFFQFGLIAPNFNALAMGRRGTMPAWRRPSSASSRRAWVRCSAALSGIFSMAACCR